jgi:hypothetical protein
MYREKLAYNRMSCSMIRLRFTAEENSVVLARKRTIPTERPPHVGEVTANFCG